MGAAWASRLLHLDYTRPVGAGVGDPVASVEWQESQVRRRAPSSYLWGSVSKDDSLWGRDSVRTGENSFARIHLKKGGATLELAETLQAPVQGGGRARLNRRGAR